MVMMNRLKIPHFLSRSLRLCLRFLERSKVSENVWKTSILYVYFVVSERKKVLFIFCME